MQYFSQQHNQNKRNRKILGLSILALSLCAISLGFILNAWANSNNPNANLPVYGKNQEATLTKTHQLLVPSTRIEENTLLNATHFKVAEYSLELVPLGLIQANELSTIIGNYSNKLLLPNSPFTHRDITPYAPLSKISIPEGFRAISIRADKLSLIDGLLKPMSRVDVLWHYINPKKESKVRTLVPFVKVLAINGKTDPAANLTSQKENTATLLVSKDDASRIELAQKEGQVSLSLYGGTGGVNSETAREARLEDLYDPSDMPEGTLEGSLTTTSNSGTIVEWNFKNNRWDRLID